MEAQLAFNQDAVALLSRAYAVQADVEKALKDTSISDEARSALTAIAEALETSDTDSYPPPMLLNQLGYLYRMTSGADQRPGRDAYTRLDELRLEVDALASRFSDR